jgi:hypothetical protein
MRPGRNYGGDQASLHHLDDMSSSWCACVDVLVDSYICCNVWVYAARTGVFVFMCEITCAMSPTMSLSFLS